MAHQKKLQIEIDPSFCKLFKESENLAVFNKGYAIIDIQCSYYRVERDKAGAFCLCDEIFTWDKRLYCELENALIDYRIQTKRCFWQLTADNSYNWRQLNKIYA